MLGLGETDMGHAAQSKLAYIYDFSQVSVKSVWDMYNLSFSDRQLYLNRLIGGTTSPSLDSQFLFLRKIFIIDC